MASSQECVGEDDYETLISQANEEFHSAQFNDALSTYKGAKLLKVGNTPMLNYYIALCHYKLSEHDKALELVADIVCSDADRNDDLDSEEDGKESFLVEATNLKAAILYAIGRYDDAKETLSCFGENLDTVTIHNDAILHFDDDPIIVLQKLEFLLSNESFPPETLSNLLSLYIRQGHDNLSADTFENHKTAAKQILSPDVFTYFETLLLSIISPDDAISLLEDAIANYEYKLREKKGIDTVNRPATSSSSRRRPATAGRCTTATSISADQAETILESYIPSLCLLAKIYWDRKDYVAAQQTLLSGADFCGDSDAWQMNKAHVLFGKKDYVGSIESYEMLLKKHHAEDADLLKVPPVALANLCVAYLMTDMNEAAEDIIKRVENEEQQQMALDDSSEPAAFHSCIINLVIGTLYCSRGNWAFGIERVIKSLGQPPKYLSADTWVHARLCFLSLADKISKLMFHIPHDTLQDILSFLDTVESHGKYILTETIEVADVDPLNPEVEHMTVSDEARLLKDLFIKICS